MAARYGGDEFVLLFAETASLDAGALAEAIRSHVEALQIPNPRSPTSGWLTVSIGVATMIPTQLDQIDKFFIAADRAMYTAREGGRNRVETVDSGAAAWETVKALVLR